MNFNLDQQFVVPPEVNLPKETLDLFKKIAEKEFGVDQPQVR
jgi:hypothetical protein